jgi:hypothetical protein
MCMFLLYIWLVTWTRIYDFDVEDHFCVEQIFYYDIVMLHDFHDYVCLTL